MNERNDGFTDDMDREEARSNWWEESLNRRQAGRRIVAIGAGAALLSTVGISLAGCDDADAEFDAEEAAENARAAIDVQKESGWNVGADKATLKFRNASATDSRQSLDGWKEYTDPAKLRDAWAPVDSADEKFVSAELINSLGQPSLQTSIQPVHSASMDEAYSRGLGMRALLESNEEPSKTAVVVDLPGPEAVAYGAALADYANLVLTLDNWPHPQGVVPSHETLGAMLYYAEEVAEKKADVPDDAPTIFIMDSNRLVEYRDAGDQFDNRYMATMPTAENLKANGIETIIYATPDDTRQTELDDLNDDFVAYRESGVNVTMMPLTDFRPASAELIAEHGEVEQSNSSHRTYYYGGHPFFLPFFFASYYPMGMGRRYNVTGKTPPRGITKPRYTPTKRPTMFSSTTTGGRSGVGRQKASGFGRVSTRTVNGRTTWGSGTGRSSSPGRSSSGRSGSYGRSGGGTSG